MPTLIKTIWTIFSVLCLVIWYSDAGVRTSIISYDFLNKANFSENVKLLIGPAFFKDSYLSYALCNLFDGRSTSARCRAYLEIDHLNGSLKRATCLFSMLTEDPKHRLGEHFKLVPLNEHSLIVLWIQRNNYRIDDNFLMLMHIEMSDEHLCRTKESKVYFPYVDELGLTHVHVKNESYGYSIMYHNGLIWDQYCEVRFDAQGNEMGKTPDSINTNLDIFVPVASPQDSYQIIITTKMENNSFIIIRSLPSQGGWSSEALENYINFTGLYAGHSVSRFHIGVCFFSDTKNEAICTQLERSVGEITFNSSRIPLRRRTLALKPYNLAYQGLLVLSIECLDSAPLGRCLNPAKTIYRVAMLDISGYYVGDLELNYETIDYDDRFRVMLAYFYKDATENYCLSIMTYTKDWKNKGTEDFIKRIVNCFKLDDIS